MAEQVRAGLQNPREPVFYTPSSTSGYRCNGRPASTIRMLSFYVAVVSVPLLYVPLLHSSPLSVLKDTNFWFLMFNALVLIVAADSGMFPSVFRDEHIEYYGSDQFCVKHVLSPCIQWMADKKDPNASLPFSQLVPLTFSEIQGSSDANLPRIEGEQKESGARLGRQAPSTAAEEKLVPHEERRYRGAPKFDGVPSDDNEKNIKDVLLLPVAAGEKLQQDHFTHQSEFVGLPSDGNGGRIKEVLPLPIAAGEKLQQGHFSHQSPPSTSEDEEEEDEYAAMSDDELNRRVEEFIKRLNREIRQQGRG